ncbi:HlyD family secretion protein [Xanthocytophaga agilis]|uniref:Efflux RND transporter periplasmic adaptor subunit n=1 Tax=Xanthocytophaga agilis TaxID=3048010 RepID=A0AAE3UFI8_9BACT|nr:HlyD family efflux transporter periplasmic adaptor subunit [Xanthocytophaga agilis]MDJ1503295.1 efflux RND transporter periplasmic adaptor subunit [Xanthocytophaga agilis]
MTPYPQQNSQIHSYEIEEIVSKVPGIIVRSGNSIFFILLLVILLLSVVIKYPDIVIVPFQLTSANAAKPVTAKNNNRLVKLLVNENDKVHKGDILAFLESTAEHTLILELDKKLDSLYTIIISANPDQLARLEEINFKNLGEIQSEFKLFNQAYNQYLSLFSNRYYEKKRLFLKTDLQFLTRTQQNLQDQVVLLEKDSELAQTEFMVQKKLASEKVITHLELNREESKYLAKRVPLLQLQTQLIDNNVKQASIYKELLELDKVIAEHKTNIIQSIEILKSKITIWKSQYIIQAPMDGVILVSDWLQQDQMVKEGQELFYIGNSTSGELGMVKIPQSNFGKVKKGQKVLIKFEAYPFQEFGLVEGEVDFISQIPSSDNTFFARVRLPKGLFTSYHKTLVFKQGMTASAEIITRDKRLIEKFIVGLEQMFHTP